MQEGEGDRQGPIRVAGVKTPTKMHKRPLTGRRLSGCKGRHTGTHTDLALPGIDPRECPLIPD